MKTSNPRISCLVAASAALFLACNSGLNSYAAEANSKNLAKGLSYTLKPKPNYKLCRDEGDNIQLTDGYMYTKNHGKSGWVKKSTVGWAHKRHIQVAFDLGKIEKISGFMVNVFGGTISAGVSFPNISISVSKDNRKFTKVKEFVIESIPADSGKQYTYVADGMRIKARYLKFDLPPKGTFVFLDEIKIFGGDFKQEQDLNSINTKVDLKLLQNTKYLTGALKSLKARIATENLSAASKKELLQLEARLAKVKDSKEFDQLNKKFMLLNAKIAKKLFPSEGLYVFDENGYLNFGKFQLPKKAHKPMNSLTIDKAGNEYETAYFMLFNTTPKAMQVKIDMPKLIDGNGNTIADNNLEYRVSDYAQSIDQKYYADPLPLIDNHTVNIQPGERKAIWLIAKPNKNARSGQYDGEIVLNYNGKQKTIPMTVNLYPVQLPNPMPMHTYHWGYIALRMKNSSPAAIEQLVKLKKSVYVDIAVLHPVALPKFKFSANGKFISANFSRYDKVTKVYLKNGITKFRYFMGFNREGSKGFASLAASKYKIGTPEWNRVMAKIITVWVAHNRQLGLKYQDYSFYPYDEPTDNHVDTILKVYSAIKKADKNAQLFMTVTTADRLKLDNLKKIGKYMDIFCPCKIDLYQNYFKKFQVNGGKYFTYDCSGPDKAFKPLGNYRFMIMRAFNSGMTGAGRWNFCDYRKSAWTDLDYSREDWTFVYDSKTAPAGVSKQEAFIPAKRIFAWRDGVEDYALLWMLKRKLPAAEFNAFFDKMFADLKANKNSSSTYEKYHKLLLNKLK